MPKFFTSILAMFHKAETWVSEAETALAKSGITPGVEKQIVQAVILAAEGNVVGAEALFVSALTTISQAKSAEAAKASA